jgi:signal transduction histidine kinase
VRELRDSTGRRGSHNVNTPDSSGRRPDPTRLRDFLRASEQQIIGEWVQRVQVLSPARGLPPTAIIDHLPQILSRIAEMVETSHRGEKVSLGDLPNRHAVDRLGRGFDFDQIVAEYGLLRGTILDLWDEQVGPAINVAELRNLDRAFDESVAQSAARFAQAREKLLKALDRVSESALGSGDLDTFLRELLKATVDGTESVDTAVVLLREGEVLRVRAAVGLDGELDRRYSLTMREGFAGHVAAEKTPVFVPQASTDPIVTSPVIRARGVRALYGVPLMRDAKVIGVAHIGSGTTNEFSDEDKLLFRSMVSRATSVVIKAQILDDLRRTETAQRFLSEASRQFAESLDVEATIGKIAHLAVPAIADWCVVDLFVDGTTQPVSLAHAGSAQQAVARTLQRQARMDAHAVALRVLRSGVAEWRAELVDEELVPVAGDAEHLRSLRELGVKSYIIVPILTRGGVSGAITLVTAESKRRYSEADLGVAEELARRVATAIENSRLYAQAQQAVAMREQVLAIVSHDLRNQVGVIAMATDQLERRLATAEISADVGKSTDTIRRTVRGMRVLLGDLLDMASIQAGRLSFDPKVLDIGPVLDEACEAHQALATAKGLDLKLQRSYAAATVRGDRKRILQVLGNLLGNAIKFTDAGGTILLSMDVGDREVTIAVKDTGPGIAAEDFSTVFEAYRTGHLQQDTGSGLGLFISRGIVQRHGGRIWVESERGQGSTFFFTLGLAL